MSPRWAAPILAASLLVPTSRDAQGVRCLPEVAEPAAEAFGRGLVLLHSFEYDDARAEFRAARASDPGFALAYWGEALTHDHPLWGEEDPEAARVVLAELETADRGESAETGRGVSGETGCISRLLSAVRVLFGSGSKAKRDRTYADSLRAVHEAFPDDEDVAALYALSLLGSSEGGRDHRTYMRAAAVLQEVLARHPRHPGALHYLIHAYDDPDHAPLGLRAARLYADVAPSSSHALHMPTHIFFALGRWDASTELNTRSWEASVLRAERLGLGAEARSYHPLYWLHYARLQQGDGVAADSLLAVARRAAEETGAGGPRWHHAMMRAHHLLHSGDFHLLEPAIATRGVGDHARAANLFAASLVLLDRGEIARARRLHEALDSLTEEGGLVEIALMADGLEGALRVAEGDTAAGFALLEEVSSREEALPFEFGPPPTVRPIHELAGLVHLDAGQFTEAERHFRAALARDPARRASERGLGRIRGSERATSGR